VCNRYREGEEGVVAVRVDDQAPIIYGTYRGTQNAAVYIPDQAANQAPSPSPGAGPGPAPSKPGTEGRPKPTNSRIKSGYLDNEGKVVNVDVVVATDPTKEGFDIQVVHSTGIIVGLAELSESLSGSQRERMLAQFKQQEAGVTYATFAEYSKQNDPKVFGEMLPDDKLISLFKQRFLFFTGKTGKVTASIPADGLKTVSANLLVLEEKSLLPVLATKVNLLVPDRK
jgi:hypothetical protein